jgi:F-type H+-transporting ATPase subunit b
VEAFLQVIAAEYRDLLHKAESAREEGAAEARASVDLFADVGEHVASVLRSAADEAEEVKEAAKREAAQLLADAEAEIERLRRTASEELERARYLRAVTEDAATQWASTSPQPQPAGQHEPEVPSFRRFVSSWLSRPRDTD